VKAYLRGVDWMNAHRGRPEWAGMVAAITQLKPEVIMQAEQPRLPTAVSVDDANETIALMVKFGMIDKPLDFGSILYQPTQ
jgi:hypothetical protein